MRVQGRRPHRTSGSTVIGGGMLPNRTNRRLFTRLKLKLRTILPPPPPSPLPSVVSSSNWKLLTGWSRLSVMKVRWRLRWSCWRGGGGGCSLSSSSSRMTGGGRVSLLSGRLSVRYLTREPEAVIGQYSLLCMYSVGKRFCDFPQGFDS